MNDTLARRLAALTGLALAAAVAVWWLGSARIALERGSDAGRSAAQALQTLCLVRAIVLSLLGLRVGAVYGWRSGAEAGLGVVAPAWPVVVLAWSASSASLWQVLLPEIALLAAVLAMPLLGQALRAVVRRAELADLLAAAVGVMLSAAVWFMQGIWMSPLP